MTLNLDLQTELKELFIQFMNYKHDKPTLNFEPFVRPKNCLKGQSLNNSKRTKNMSTCLNKVKLNIITSKFL